MAELNVLIDKQAKIFTCSKSKHSNQCTPGTAQRPKPKPKIKRQLQKKVVIKIPNQWATCSLKKYKNRGLSVEKEKRQEEAF